MRCPNLTFELRTIFKIDELKPRIFIFTQQKESKESYEDLKKSHSSSRGTTVKQESDLLSENRDCFSELSSSPSVVTSSGNGTPASNSNANSVEHGI